MAQRDDDLAPSFSFGGTSGGSRGGQADGPQAVNGGAGGGKGGRPDIDPADVASNPLNNDKSYGYYNPQGQYVSAFKDMFDGGGANTSGNYFSGGGYLSAIGNVAKVRPMGPAREKDAAGNYIVDIADIGYRDAKDMYDRGGPQASGGKFAGGGLLSGLANLAYGLSGKEFGERTPYGLTNAPVTTSVSTRSNQPDPISVPQDFSNLSNAPAIRSSLVGYSPQVVAGTPDPYGVGQYGEMAMANYAPVTPMGRTEINTMSDMSSGTAPSYAPVDDFTVSRPFGGFGMRGDRGEAQPAIDAGSFPSGVMELQTGPNAGNYVVTQGPHAGKIVDRKTGRLVMP